MGWSGSPRTFVDGEVETASIFNTELRDRMNFLHSPPSCSVATSSAQLIAPGTSVPVALGAEFIDTDNMHSTVTNISRITINTTGKYLVIAHIAWDPSASGGTYREVAIVVNGVTKVRFTSSETGGVADAVGQECSKFIPVTAGDYVELWAYHVATGSLNIGAELDCFFQAG